MSRWRHRGQPASPDCALACRRAARLLQSYLDGEVDEVTASRVALHLERCRRCGLEAATYVDIKKALGRRATIPPGAAQRLRAFSDTLLTADDDTPDRDLGEQA